MGAHEPWYAYLYLIPLLLLPWTPFTGFALFRAVRDGSFLLPIYRLLICWVLPGLALLSISAFKAKHYTIPLLPPFVVLAAIGFSQYLAIRRSAVRLHSGWLWGAVAVGMSVATCVILAAGPRGQWGMIVAIAIAGVGLSLMIEAERRRCIDWVRRIAFGTVWCVMTCVAWGVLPAHDSYRPLAELATRINARGVQAEPIFMVRLPDNAITYYLEPRVARYDQEFDFADALANRKGSDPLYIVAPLKSRAVLAAHGRLETLDESGPVGKHGADANRAMLFRLTPDNRERMATRP